MFTHCVRANMIAVEPALSPQISIERLAILYPAFTSAVRTFHVKSPLGNKNNVTIVVFENAEDGKWMVHVLFKLTIWFLFSDDHSIIEILFGIIHKIYIN